MVEDQCRAGDVEEYGAIKENDHKADLSRLAEMLEQARMRSVYGRQNVSLAESLIKVTKESLVNYTMHGLPPIVRAENIILKILWIIMFLGAAAYCWYLIAISIKAYLNYEVVTNVYQILEIPTKFQFSGRSFKVRVCNNNPYVTDTGVVYVKKVLQETGTDIYELASEQNSYAGYLQGKYTVGTNTLYSNLTKAEKQALGLTMEQMLVSCSYASKSCTADEFWWSFDVQYGNCYSFNYGLDVNGTTLPDKLVSRTGWYDGFILELFVGLPTDVYSLSYGNGLHVFINNKTIFSSSFEGYSLAAGSALKIGVKRVFTYDLPIPYSSCTSDDDIQSSSSIAVQAILATGYSYRYIDCIPMCFNLYVIDKCQCQDTSSITYFKNTYGFCVNDSQIYCDYLAYIEFMAGDVHASCESYCPLECSSINYDLTFTSTQFPSYPYYQFLLNQTVFRSKYNNNESAMTYDNVKQSMVSLNINYADMSYVYIEQSAKMEIIDLISGIGGVLGLFLGMSFLSFFEFFDTVFVLIETCIKYKLGKRIAPKKDPLVSQRPKSSAPQPMKFL